MTPAHASDDIAVTAEDRSPIPGSGPAEPSTARGGKYLTFTLVEQGYGIGIRKVKEIIGMMNVSPVPQTPEYVKGVINLRGKVIPVIDLRLKFSLDAMDYNERTCIIVTEIAGESDSVPVGVIVDAVSEVLNIRDEEIEDTPAFGAGVDTEYLLGIAKTEGGVKILLDIDRILNVTDIAAVKKTM